MTDVLLLSFCKTLKEKWVSENYIWLSSANGAASCSPPFISLKCDLSNNEFLDLCACPMGFSDSKESAFNAGDLGSIPGSWRSPLKEMATSSSIPTWKIPWTEEPSRLQSMRSRRVEQDWTSNTLMGFRGGTRGTEPTCQCRTCKRHGFDPCVGKIPRRRAWQPTPGFWPGESPWTESLAGYSPWGHKKLYTTEANERTHTRLYRLRQ